MKEQELLKKFPKTFSEELGIKLASKKEQEIFKWFLASVLFGKRISTIIAENTFKEFEKAGVFSTEKILEKGWDGLVQILDDGGYVRYDFSTATKLLGIAKKLKKEYAGKLNKLHEKSENEQDLEKRLLEFKGIGPVTVNIFLRELRPVWKKANVSVAKPALLSAKKLGIDLKKYNRKSKKFVKLESALVKYYLERKKGL